MHERIGEVVDVAMYFSSGGQPGSGLKALGLPAVLSVQDAAAFLRVSRDQLMEAIGQGQVPTVSYRKSQQASEGDEPLIDAVKLLALMRTPATDSDAVVRVDGGRDR